MKKRAEPFLKIGAIFTLAPIMGGLIVSLWSIASEYSTLKAEVGSMKVNKAEKNDISTLNHKIDKIILGLCIINRKACVLKEEEK